MNSIYHRVSIRKYQDKPVEPEKIEAILKAAMQAPSAANQQPWEFYVVTDKKKSPLGNLRMIRENGMDAFLEQEKKNWTCPNCGKAFSVHNRNCPHCGKRLDGI